MEKRSYMRPQGGAGKQIYDYLKDRLQLPEHCQSFSVHFKFNDLVRVDCSYTPTTDELDVTQIGDATQRFHLDAAVQRFISPEDITKAVTTAKDQAKAEILDSQQRGGIFR